MVEEQPWKNGVAAERPSPRTSKIQAPYLFTPTLVLYARTRAECLLATLLFYPCHGSRVPANGSTIYQQSETSYCKCAFRSDGCRGFCLSMHLLPVNVWKIRGPETQRANLERIVSLRTNETTTGCRRRLIIESTSSGPSNFRRVLSGKVPTDRFALSTQPFVPHIPLTRFITR